MIQVLGSSWALFLGMFMLMIGNGLQGTLLGLRGEIEGFSTLQLSIVMSGYFVGFLFASKMAPEMIRRVGHVRVFAALGSTISAVLIMYPVLADPIAWTLGRVVIGFCFCGVYVTAESWLNDASSNETRGQALSLYMIVQMAGIVTAQFIITRGDVSGFVLFIVPSVLVSMAFAPILLSIKPTPAFGRTKPMKVVQLIRTSPLAAVGMFLLGGVFSAQFGMSAVYGARAGFSVGEISLFVSAIYLAALVAQYPIGWMSDRLDRRILIIAVALIGGVGCLAGAFWPASYTLAVVSGALVGGTSNPLYALLIAYTNDYLEKEDMAAASGGLLFINGVGAIMGPLTLGYMLDTMGPRGYWVFLGVLMFAVGMYGIFRMTRRSRADIGNDNVTTYANFPMTTSPILAEMAQEVYLDAEETGEAALAEPAE
ncbi:MFS transporter [Loktanella salsilacus]|jgi:MFS family permease|uniref:Predicted arabinose efflux permease, MFS family n=1 Tax=Loktanella salsilacus TaxID=195913 RepID=A0A1I4BPH9_9RHOB|nr:MFS transporter [Loktanella salsilacus]MBU0780292.1 MFS transporter [Alphaproteobacteria bacterium]MBU1836711.1 MFS transporter [Alphaproteobacteria bacterium]UTH45533.1 MFS transporter [Loktanella salsilacus]UTH49307.1 MFS transporter [Loktanella salsilacus]SFK70585.1 Predicted arabinose efflux permease, MFS family [Loktanella salsilacus]